ncbi:MAG: precorrin-6y C5,15-methyltransferase (decarboxylating) subunit CbiE [Marinilabiliaceae bacterium]|nr:precorrin-6y C5,15-methyltransferase (decarboxylating) subunit CbiE [Marinilabiliaceae bacterium]
MNNLIINIFGIADSNPVFSVEQEKIISSCINFAGGERHYQLVKNILPENHYWKNITVPLNILIDEINNTQENWIVFASGDPWFFGIANTLKREFPTSTINSFSQFNSIQTLGHRFGINYGEYKTISLTGRPWKEFDKALIIGEKRIALLTDRKKTPSVIAERMLYYGYSNYRMYYGEHLGGKEEKVLTLTLKDALTLNCKHPNCLLLEKTNSTIPQKLIPENEFQIIDNRPNMITKMPVRLTTLASMELYSKKVLWDIGSCTGSISIEARLNYPDLQIIAFEKHNDRMLVMENNCRIFKCPGIELLRGDYMLINKDNLTPPNAVFLGGYSGNMEDILNDISNRLPSEGIISFNSVSETSEKRFLKWAYTNSYVIKFKQLIKVDKHNPIQIITIKKCNPH